MVIRLVLSHVTSSERPPRQTADQIAWIAARVLAPRRATGHHCRSRVPPPWLAVWWATATFRTEDA